MEGRGRKCTPRLDRWLVLSANMIILGCGGLTYTYAVYSEHLKENLHYTQEQTDDIGAAKDFGSVLGLLSGLFYNFYPPWVTVCIGALLHFFGYSMVWMTLIGRVPPSFWLLDVRVAMGGTDCWRVWASLQSFGEHRGTAMGILKAQVGLSGAMFVLIYQVFLEPNVDKFILLAGLAPTIITLALAYFVRPSPPSEQDKDVQDIKQRFQMTKGAIVFLGVFLMLVITVEGILRPGETILMVLATAMLLIASIMYAIPVLHRPLDLLSKFISWEGEGEAYDGIVLTELSRKRHRRKRKPFQPQLEGIHEGDEDPLQESPEWDSDTENVVFEENGQMETENEIPVESSLKDSLLGIDFWLVTLVLLIGGGTGLAIINNFAQIGEAVGDNSVDVYVGLISIWSCFGRLVAGYGSDLVMKLGYPRPICLCIVQVVMCTCCLLLATGCSMSSMRCTPVIISKKGVPILYVGSAMVGLAYGSHWSLTPPILAEVFGLQHFATLYKINSAFPPIGAYVFSAKVVGLLYDREAALYQRQFKSIEANTCYGRRCFGFALLLIGFMCAISAAASIWFTIRTRKFYSREKSFPLKDCNPL